MSDNINPKSVEDACMADLSRARQEELPLSAQARRGPTYNPSLRNGVNHISGALREKLNIKWTVEIKDEESEQMKGLQLEDARPWAKDATKDLLHSGALGSFSRQPNQPGRPGASQPQSGAAQPRNQSRLGVNNASACSVPPHLQDQAQATTWSQGIRHNIVSTRNREALARPMPTQPKGRPKKADADAYSRPMAKPEALPTTNSAKSTPLQLHLRREAPPNPDEIEELVLCHGHLENVPGRVERSAFVAEFTVSVMMKKNEAFITLIQSTRGKRRFAILDLEHPEFDGEFCVLKSRSLSQMFYLRFANIEDTKQFCTTLQYLQRTAKVARQNPPKAKEVETVAVASIDTSEQSPPRITTTTAESVAEISRPKEVEPAAVRAEPPRAQETDRASSHGGEQLLIDVDNYDEVRNTIIDDGAHRNFTQATTKLINIVEKLFKAWERNIMKAGEQLSEEIYKGIEDGALEFWIEQGGMSGFDEDIKEHLVATVHTLVLLKAKMLRAARKTFTEPLVPEIISPSATENTNGRLQYTAEELERYRGNAVPCPEEIIATDYLPRPSPLVPRANDQPQLRGQPNATPNASTNTQATPARGLQRPSMRDAVSAVASHRGWIELGAQQPINSSQLDDDLDTPMGNTEFATASAAPLVTSSSAPRRPPPGAG